MAGVGYTGGSRKAPSRFNHARQAGGGEVRPKTDSCLPRAKAKYSSPKKRYRNNKQYSSKREANMKSCRFS
jgi:hypothetical protein